MNNEWYPIIAILIIFIIFIALWAAGLFNTPKTTTGSTGATGINKEIQAAINVIMPPSNWSTAGTTGNCLIYNYPIVNSTFPTITNKSYVVEQLESSTNNRCYWSNELALQSTYRTCSIGPCYDDLGNEYATGNRWTYYNPCGTTCYSTGMIKTMLVIGLNSSDYSPQAIKFYNGSCGPTTPNIQDENQYHLIYRYNTGNSTGSTSTTGRYCNVTHAGSGQYLTIFQVDNEGDQYYVPTYTTTRPTTPLWFIAPPNSVGGTKQGQKLVYTGGANMGTNPSLYTYATYAQNNSLTCIGYGYKSNIREPFTGLFMINSMIPDNLYLYTADIQFVDISRYQLLMNTTTTEYPFYRWSSTN